MDEEQDQADRGRRSKGGSDEAADRLTPVTADARSEINKPVQLLLFQFMETSMKGIERDVAKDDSGGSSRIWGAAENRESSNSHAGSGAASINMWRISQRF